MAVERRDFFPMSRMSKLEKRVKELDQFVRKAKEEDEETGYRSVFGFFANPHYSTPSLEEQIETLREEVKQAKTNMELLLKHLKLEYVKVTEENGKKTVTEKLRKRRK